MSSASSPFSLNGKTILVTGASSGIGQAIAVGCANQGARVLLLGRDPDRLNISLQMCGTNEKHDTLQLDLNGSKVWPEMLTAFIQQHAPIHGFVHAAGVSPTVPFKILKHDQMVETFQLNVFSAVSIVQAITKNGIKSNDGLSVVMISSVMSEVGEKGKSLYAMTKAALIGLVKSLALEYADKKVRFNAISPSVVNTPLSMKSVYRSDESAMNKIQEQHPLGLGEVDDVANAAIYLLSDASIWVTGTNMIVDGGYLAR